MDFIPIIDWNGNGEIDPQDIATTLAISEAEEEEEADDIF